MRSFILLRNLAMMKKHHSNFYVSLWKTIETNSKLSSYLRLKFNFTFILINLKISVLISIFAPPNSKVEKNYEEIVCFSPAGSYICRSFKEHDLITGEWKVYVVVSWGVSEFCSP